MKRQANSSIHSQSWILESQELVRGISGGFLFGIPLLYTMEVWQIGSFTEPPLMLTLLGITYFVVFLLIRVSGFRRHQHRTLKNTLLESVEALAIGLVCTTFILILLRQINQETPLDEALGKIILESIPFAMGAALAELMLSDESSNSSSSSQDKKPIKSNFFKANKINLQDTLDDISATFIGAMFIAFNIAPTDEVRILAGATSPPWLIAIMIASLIISYCIVFAAGFRNQQKRHRQQGLFQSPHTETIVSYLISLITSVLMLWFFQKLSFSEPGILWLNSTLILGLPATVGGAAGRLAI
jgi:putative integral membrane protein (TIGR02587 family)